MTDRLWNWLGTCSASGDGVSGVRSWVLVPDGASFFIQGQSA
jgi:hypothetical protein